MKKTHTNTKTHTNGQTISHKHTNSHKHKGKKIKQTHIKNTQKHKN